MDKQTKDILRKLAIYTSLPFEFFVLIGFGAWLGYKLDNKITLKFPIFTVILAVVGFAIGLYHVFKSLNNEKKRK